MAFQQVELSTPPSLAHFARTAPSSSMSAAASNIFTLNTHSVAQWSHDLMIDARLFDSLDLGDIIEVRPALNRQTAFAEAAASTAKVFYHESESEADDSEASYDVADDYHAHHGHVLSPGGPIQGTLQEEDDDLLDNLNEDASMLLMEVTTLDQPLGRVQISINRYVADAFHFPRFSAVHVSKLSKAGKARYEAGFVEISFRGRYLSNGELWLVKSALKGKPVYVGKTIKLLGLKMKVEQIHHILPEGGVDENRKAMCGIVSERTRFVFRSGSAQIYWLIQCSVEMWGFADDGDLMSERLFDRFIPDILDRWNATNARHSLTVIFFTRTVFNGEPDISLPLHRFAHPDDHRRYMDLYHVALSNVTRTDWKTLLGPLQDMFHAFPRRANWGTRVNSVSGNSSSICGLPSLAQEGNVLEAINLSLNAMQNQHIDRDLTRTGQLMVLMTAGSGVFEVDSRLSKLTKDRMINHAVGCDVISLTQPPPHVVPLFVHNPCYFNSVGRAFMYEFDQQHPFCDVFNPKYNGLAFSEKDMERERAQGGSSSSSNSPTFTGLGSPLKSNAFDNVSPQLNSTAGGGGENANTSSQTSFAQTNNSKRRIPVFAIPYWINLSFPFHQPSTQFQPVFENRMFPIPEPHRSNFPSALLAPLERASMKVPLDLDLSNQVATWATARRIPSRDEMRAWFPLVADYFSYLRPSQASSGSSSRTSSQHHNLLLHSLQQQQQQQQQQAMMMFETRRISISPGLRKSSTGVNLNRALSSSAVNLNAPPPMFRSTSSANPSPRTTGQPAATTGGTSLVNTQPGGSFVRENSSENPNIVAASSASSAGTPRNVAGLTSSNRLQPHRMEPSPSLAALQLFTGGQTDRSQPKVSWITSDLPGSFSLPPSSTAASTTGQQSSALRRGTFLGTSDTIGVGNLSRTQTATSQHHLHFDISDEATIRAKHRRHDQQVFAPGALSSGTMMNRKRYSAVSNLTSPAGGGHTLERAASSTLNSTVNPLKQSVNDLAALAMTPSMGQRVPHTAVGVSGGGGGGGGGSVARNKSTIEMAKLRLDRNQSSTGSQQQQQQSHNNSNWQIGGRDSYEFQTTLQHLPSSSELDNESSASSQGSSSCSSLSSSTLAPPLPYPSMIPPSASTSSFQSNSSHSSNSHFANPFHLESLMKWYCDRPSYSRSRWLHLFPNSRLAGLRLADLENDWMRHQHEKMTSSGGGGEKQQQQQSQQTQQREDAEGDKETEGGSEENEAPARRKVGEINWKSLLAPAMLPLTTGFAPSADVLAQAYTVANYSLVGTKNMDQVVADIICQRLAEDFQLYDPEDFLQHASTSSSLSSSSYPPQWGGFGASHHQTASHRVTDALVSPTVMGTKSLSQQQQQQKTNNPSTSTMRMMRAGGGFGNNSSFYGPKENYVLTIGHHVHVLSYSPPLMKLDVKTFERNHHKNETEDLNPTEYKFTLFDSDFEELVQACRYFQDESSSEFSWSYVDNLLMGESADYIPGSELFFRFKRLSFCLLDEQAVHRLLEYLHLKASGLKNDDHDEEESDHPEDEVEEIEAEEEDNWPMNQVQFMKKNESSRGGTTGLDLKVSKGITVELDLDGPLPTRESLRPREWVYVNVDDKYHSQRAFHLDIRWMVASAEGVHRFIEDAKARIGDGLLIQVANYCLNFDDHPFIVPRRITLKGSKSRRGVCEAIVRSGKMVLESESIAQEAFVLMRRSMPVGSVFCRVSFLEDETSSEDQTEEDVDLSGQSTGQVVLDFLTNPFVPCSDYSTFISEIVELL